MKQLSESEGLKHGFPLKYSSTRLSFNTKNLRSVYEKPDLVKANIKKEVSLDRVVGPFTFRPFPTLRVSPIEIVPKNDGDFRMIHHLSHPTHYSVSDFITIEFCTVKYASIDDAVSLEQRIGKNGKLAKVDIKSAFRFLRVFSVDFDQLGFMFDDKYYFDKCLPMGASISCALFEKLSTALHWFTETRTGNRDILHYLDDFLFGGEADSTRCKDTLFEFKGICELWGVPLAEDKTIEPTEVLTFLGVEFDTRDMMLMLPGEKR